jgi:metal-responsive CopG/Arc/MetJ family transcriptional regulator
MEKRLLDDIDKSLTVHRYSTRTEFIRDAIRTKLSQQEKEDAIRRLEGFRGKFKRQISDEEAGEIAFKKIARRLGVKLD